MGRLVYLFFLIVSLLVSGGSASAGQLKTTLKQKWKSFCERHLVADDPFEKAIAESPFVDPRLRERWTQEVLYKHGTVNVDLYADFVIKMYRDKGGANYWLARKIGSSNASVLDVNLSYINGVTLKQIGKELNFLWSRQNLSPDRREAIEQAQFDYSIFEGPFVMVWLPSEQRYSRRTPEDINEEYVEN